MPIDNSKKAQKENQKMSIYYDKIVEAQKEFGITLSIKFYTWMKFFKEAKKKDSDRSYQSIFNAFYGIGDYMDEFKDCLGNIIDLDDTDNYPEEWRNMNIHKLFSKCMKQAGSSLFYMDFLHSDSDWGLQKHRVKILCKELVKIWKEVRQYDCDTKTHILFNEEEYRLALMKWLYRFEDEVENQC